MAIKADQNQIGVQPSNRLVREFRTDLPDPSNAAVDRFAATVGAIGQDMMASQAKSAAQEAAFSAELGKDEQGNFIKPPAPDSFGMYASGLFDEIVNQRVSNSSLADFESQALKIRADYVDQPEQGAKVIDAAMKARLEALPPELRGRLEVPMIKERNQHVGTMQLEYARKIERQTIKGIETDIETFTNKAADAAKVDTPAAIAQATTYLDNVESSIGALVSKNLLPPNALERFKETRNGIMAGGKILGAINRRMAEGNLQEQDLIDLERIIRSPYANENVMGITSEGIRQSITTDQARDVIGAQIRTMRGLLTKQLAESNQEAAYQGVIQMVQQGKAGLPIDMGENQREYVINRWARENGLADNNGRLVMTPANLDRIQSTFGELPKKSVAALFQNSNTLTPEAIEARMDTFDYLRNMPTGNNENTVALGLMNPRDFAFLSQYKASRTAGASPVRAYEVANEMLKRGKAEAVSHDKVADVIAQRYSLDEKTIKTGRDVLDLMDDFFPSESKGTLGFGGADWKNLTIEQRQGILMVANQTMQLNETLTTKQAMEYAVKRFMTTHIYDPAQAGANGKMGTIVPSSQAIPRIYDIKENSENAKTSDYVETYVRALLGADKNKQPASFNIGDADRLIPRNQAGFTLPEPSSLKFGENLALKHTGANTANPGYYLVYKPDGMAGWLPLQGQDRQPVTLYFKDAAAAQDKFARELAVDYGRATAVYNKMTREGLLNNAPETIPAAPMNPATGDRPLGRIDLDSVLAPPRTANERATPGLKATPGTRPMQLRNDADAPILDRLGEFVVPTKSSAILDGVDSTFARRMQAMVNAMPEEVRKGFFISSAYRSTEEQAKIYNAALLKYGNPSTARQWAAEPGRSFHNHGKAMDLRFGNRATREWVHANAQQFGLHFPMKHEPWHIEPLGTRNTKNATFDFDADSEDDA